ncbi:MAG: glycosyltransferase family 39 protein [Xenococcaceae cyanobacterium MO_188.B32]|nr:glycosyltransferase family 39 protein [Xenococcaceae cyanobacterium MO_188.B32]
MIISPIKSSKKLLAKGWHSHIPPKPWRFLIIIVLVIGIFFRFTNLDQKVYWYDEVSTSLTIVGYTEAEIVQSFNNTDPIEPQVLQQYQSINPEKSVINTVGRLVEENPHHPPLYYVIARLWSKVFGTSILAMRSLPAMISLLAFPGIYWLCLELFERSITGWVAVALIAVSPIHVVYAQEARQYSLWIVIILFSSAALLRAYRLKTLTSWSAYGITLVLGLYTQLLFSLVALGQGIYLVVNEDFKLSKTIKSYLVFSVASFMLFVPWIIVLVNQYSQAERLTNWTQSNQTIIDLLKFWTRNLSRIFFDIGHYGNTEQYLLLYGLIYVIVAILVGYSIFFLCLHTPKKTWLFILTLMGLTTLALVLPDLVLGGKRSITPRYLLPSYLGIQLAIAYLISSKITNIYVQPLPQKIWHFIVLTIFSCGILSSAIHSQSQIWWNKQLNTENPVISRIINQATQPLVVNNAPIPYLISLSYMLESKVRILPEAYCTNCILNQQAKYQLNIPLIPEGFSDVFLLKTYPLESWRNELEKQQDYKIELLFQGKVSWLFRLEKN